MTFRVEGEGVSINPETGELSIATDRLQDGIAVRVTAANSGGTAQSVFRLTVRAMPVDGAPALVAAPALVGEARIGAAIELDAGRWSGTPEPVLAYQWQLDGADIAEAVGTSYTPLPADDGKALACRVTATNAAGAAEALTEPVAVTYAAPVASGTLEDLVLARGAEAAIVEAAPVFVGANLSFAVEGTGATIDAATGRVTISTDVALADEPVTVLAVNSGGSAESSFRVTVGAAAPALVAAPTLTGEGRIGAPLEVAPGEWSGAPKPAIALQWLSDGAAIEGAVAASYVPGPADDGKAVACRVTASNEAGAAEAVTEPVVVTYAAPVVTGALADVSYIEGSGDQTVDAAAVFDGDALAFAVEGADATIDPATGTVTIPTDARLSDAPVTVTASNSGGAAAVDFRVTVAADVPVVVAPALIAAPALVGTAEIGREVTVEPGAWSGGPALAFQWLRDGAVIEGATAAAYVPVPADDAAALACRVTATNSAGSAEAVTEPLGVSYAAPTAKGALPELVLDEDSGDEIVEAAGDFTGENLGFAVSGAGATVDPVTGRVTIPTAEPLEDLVTVSASNSGGTAESSFQVTVEAIAPEEGVPALRPEEWEIITIYHPTENTPVVAFRLLGEAPVEPGHLYATLLEDTTGTAPGDGGWHQCVRHPEDAKVWIRHAPNGAYKSWLDITPRLNTEESFTLRYALEDPAVPVAEAEFSPDSDRKAFVMVLPGEPKPEDPVLPGNDTVKSVITRNREEAEANNGEGYPNGSGQQQMVSAAQCESFPDVIYHGQDMGGLWVTDDHGRTRAVPQRTGLTSVHNQGVAVDPYDPKRVLVYAPEDFPMTHGLGGVFFSKDGGHSFERLWAGKDIGNINHSHLNAVEFCRASVTGTPGQGGHATRAYACLAQDGKGDGSMDFLRIDLDAQGVAKVTKLGTLSRGQVGNINHIQSDPSDINRLYLATSNGIWRMNNAASMSGLSNVLAGSFNGPTYISPNGRTLYAGKKGDGVFKSTNGGNGWSKIHSDSALDKLFVNPWRPADQAITTTESNFHRFTQNEWGNVISTSANSYEKRPGYTSGLTVGYQHCHVFFHPNNAQLFLLACQKTPQRSSTDYRSSDGGRSWQISSRGMDGTRLNGQFAPLMFDPNDRNRIALSFLDIGIWYTENGGRWQERINFPFAQLGALHSTVLGMIMLPKTAVSGTRFVLGLGRTGKGKLVVHQDGTNYTPIGGDSERLHGLCYNTDDPRYVFGARLMSDNYGHQNSWSVIGSLSADDNVWGCTTHDPNGQAIFAINTGGNGQIVKRSTNNARSWSTVLDAGYKLYDYQGDPTRAHPRNKDVLFTRMPNGEGIRRWDLSKESSSNRLYFDFGKARMGIPANVPFNAAMFAVDPRFPNVMYVSNKHVGTAYGLMRTVDDGENWESLSHLVPDMGLGLCEVHPLTGNLFVGSTNGSFMLSPPYADPNDLLKSVNLADAHVLRKA